MKKYLHIFVAVILVLSSITMIVLWETYLDDRINTVKVVVAARNLEKNHVIVREDIKIEKIKVGQAVDRPIQQMEVLIGKETSQFVAKGNQFVEQMIDKYGLEPNDDQLIFSIPREWIYSSPGSLRRKDKVYIYPIPDSDNRMIILGATGSEAKPILKGIVVAFAKDSVNHEVKPTANSDKRIDATGAINNLELVMTPQQYAILEDKFLAGYKFNFAYR